MKLILFFLFFVISLFSAQNLNTQSKKDEVLTMRHKLSDLIDNTELAVRVDTSKSTEYHKLNLISFKRMVFSFYSKFLNSSSGHLDLTRILIEDNISGYLLSSEYKLPNDEKYQYYIALYDFEGNYLKTN